MNLTGLPQVQKERPPQGMLQFLQQTSKHIVPQVLTEMDNKKIIFFNPIHAGILKTRSGRGGRIRPPPS